MRSMYLARNGQYNPEFRRLPKTLEDTSKLTAPGRVTRTNFHSQYQQMLGAIVQNLVARNFFFTPSMTYFYDIITARCKTRCIYDKTITRLIFLLLNRETTSYPITNHCIDTNIQIFENFSDVTSFYTFLLLFKQNVSNYVAKKKAGAVIVFAEASDRATFIVPVIASQRWPFFATNDPEAYTALPPPEHPRRR